MSSNSITSFGTVEEFRFLSGLGSFSADGARYTRAYLLKGYLQGAARRKDWGEIDREKAVEKARAELKREEASPKEEASR